MWDVLPETVDRVVYLDGDVLPLRKLPELPDVDFAAAREANWISNEVCALWPALTQPEYFVNSGVFVANRKTAPMFKRVLERQRSAGDGQLPWLRDEVILNVELQLAVKNGEITFDRLPTKWNQLTLHADHHTKEPYMMHFAGVCFGKDPKIKSGFIAQIIEYLNEIEA